MTDILPNSRASRGPGGSRRIGILNLGHSLEHKISVEAWRGNVELCTAITVSRGYSAVWLTLKPDDFRAVIDKMIEADPEAVLAALPAAKSAAKSAAAKKQKFLERLNRR